MNAGKKTVDRRKPLSFDFTANSFLDLLSHFRSAQITNALVAHSQPPVVYEFQFGNELLSYRSPLPTETCFDGYSSTPACYLIGNGYARLLCQNVHSQRQTSVDLIGAGAIIGADHLFCSMPLPYQAIAASRCQLIQLPYEWLSAQLERSLQFRDYLSKTAQQRERLIFFKHFRQQRFGTSRTLKHILLPNLIEQRVHTGEYLSQALSDGGYFWLRSGQILSQLNSSKGPVIGDGWGYPDAVPDDWVAQTDLVIYKLSLDSGRALDLLHS